MYVTMVVYTSVTLHKSNGAIGGSDRKCNLLLSEVTIPDLQDYAKEHVGFVKDHVIHTNTLMTNAYWIILARQEAVKLLIHNKES
jgi:hypothetical protein